MTAQEHRELALGMGARAVDALERSIELREQAGSLADVEGYEQVTEFCRLTDEADEQYRAYCEFDRAGRKHMGIYNMVQTQRRNRREAARTAVMGW